MVHKHTVKSFDDDLDTLRAIISQMGSVAENQIRVSVDAMLNLDTEAAEQIIAEDDHLDQMERDAERLSIEVFARRAPMADDLRELIAALKISNILERIGDYGKNIAKRVTVLSQVSTIKPVSTIPIMAKDASGMVRDVVDAFLERDATKAKAVWEYDKHVDELNNTVFRELLTYMMENPRLITQCTHLLFIAKNLERVGDHATNIAEIAYFAATGETLDGSRPKAGDINLPGTPKAKDGRKRK